MERIIWALLFSIFASAAFSVSAADKLCASQLDGHVSALELVASKPAGISRDTADWAAKELAVVARNHKPLNLQSGLFPAHIICNKAGTRNHNLCK